MEEEFVQVPVPKRFVHEIYRRIVELEEGNPLVANEAPSDSDDAEGRSELIRRMYFESHAPHRALLELLATNPDEWFSTSRLAELLEIDSGARGAGGMMGAFGRRAKNRYGSELPWRHGWNAATDERFYIMDRDVAAIVLDAAEEARQRGV